MHGQKETLKKRAVGQMRKMIEMIEAGATIVRCIRYEDTNAFGSNVKVVYDEKIKTRAKILFSGEDLLDV